MYAYPILLLNSIGLGLAFYYNTQILTFQICNYSISIFISLISLYFYHCKNLYLAMVCCYYEMTIDTVGIILISSFDITKSDYQYIYIVLSKIVISFIYVRITRLLAIYNGNITNNTNDNNHENNSFILNNINTQNSIILEDICVICCDNNISLMELKCTHGDQFCNNCIKQLNKCPLCRSVF